MEEQRRRFYCLLLKFLFQIVMRMPSGILDLAIYLITLHDVKIQGLKAKCIQLCELALLLYRYFFHLIQQLGSVPRFTVWFIHE